MERRFINHGAVEVRKDEDDKPVIFGRAASFYDGTPETEYQLFPDLKERIMPRAFNKALSEKQDVRALFNHNENLVLGRTKSKTLKLSKSLRGLDYEINPPDTQGTKDLLVLIQRGDVDGSSFAFEVTDQRFVKESDADVREILSVILYDVSPVTFPAYKSTSVGTRDDLPEGMCVRSASDATEARAAYDAWKAEQAREAEALRAKLSGYSARAQEVT